MRSASTALFRRTCCALMLSLGLSSVGQAHAEDAAARPAAANHGWDISDVPVSTAALGEFPYFGLPAGYENPNAPIPVAELDRVPFWTGDRLEWVEGRVHESLIHPAQGAAFSQFELTRHIGEQVAAAGGVQVTDSRIPAKVRASLPDSYTVGRVGGVGDIYNNPVQTWVVRRADRAIWIHLCTNSASGGWIVAETR